MFLMLVASLFAAQEKKIESVHKRCALIDPVIDVLAIDSKIATMRDYPYVPTVPYIGSDGTHYARKISSDDHFWLDGWGGPPPNASSVSSLIGGNAFYNKDCKKYLNKNSGDSNDRNAYLDVGRIGLSDNKNHALVFAMQHYERNQPGSAVFFNLAKYRSGWRVISKKVLFVF